MDNITTLVFDWGGTLMLEDRRFISAMVDWPEVHAVDGIGDALHSLEGHYRMAVATNATESGAEQVRAALKRVDLEHFFSHIFTYQELKARKPAKVFFREIERALAVAPEQLVMVGDDFWADMGGACQAGWRAIWYRSGEQACPGLMPPHQAEIKRMSDLEAALFQADLPDPQTCLLWCLEQGAPFELIQHMRLVAAIAYQLAVWLQNQGIEVDPILAQRGGLLHDLAKISTRQLATEADHGAVAASLLRERGLPALAEIAARHMIFNLGTEMGPRTWEEKLVYFADRLAEGGRAVTLQKRLEGLSRRYPERGREIQQMLEPITALETEIASEAGIPSEALVDAIIGALKGR
jgi:putative hydrolase of the HAD superfamily